MATLCGTSVVLSKGVVAVGVFRNPSLTVNNADVEVGAGQWREYLGGCGEKSVDISGDIVLEDSADGKVLVQDVFDGAIDTYTLDIPLVGTFVGLFKVGGSLSAPKNDAITGSVELKSSGEIVYTPVA